MLNKQEETLLKELLNKYKQGYISGLIPGSNITFSPSGCRNKIVSSTGGGGGGSPAGSDTQIQYNNAGAFGASSDLIFNYTDKIFQVGDVTETSNHIWEKLDNLGKSYVINGLGGISTSLTTPVFTGTGADNLSVSGTYSGTPSYPVDFVATITDTNVNCTNLSYVPVGGYQIGETITGDTSYATAVVVASYGTYLAVDSIVGSFTPSESITGSVTGSGGVLNSLLSQFAFTTDIYQLEETPNGGGTTTSIIPCVATAFPDGLTISFTSESGHVVSDNWTWQVIETTGYGNFFNIDFDKNQGYWGDVDSIRGGTMYQLDVDGGSLLSTFLNSYTVSGNTTNTNYLVIDDTKAEVTFNNDGTTIFQSKEYKHISIDSVNKLVKIGTFDGGNGTSITIDDAAQTINFNNNYSFPFADGAAGQVLGTDGSGQLGWQSVSGGGGQIAFTKTKAEIDTLIAGNDLVAGALYEITGVHPTLYDDGTTSGTTVYLRAISDSKLEVQGMGKFYNPKYNQSVNGFGIWNNKMYGTFSGIVGKFNYLNKEGVTANNGATGLMLAQGMIQWVSGDWSAATSITGDVSSATANISGFVSPSYSIGDKVIWGGYSWTNVNGNVGASVDVLNLDAEWTKNVYDTTNYNIAYDVIEYDYANDMIIRRFEKESNVDVKCSKAQYDWFAVAKGFVHHSIAVQQFGNIFNASTAKGQLNIDVDNGYNESINFSGLHQVLLTFGSGAYQSSISFGSYAYQFILTFGSNAYQRNLTFGSNAHQYNLTFGSNVNQQGITFGSNAKQENLTFGSNARQQYLTFGSDAYQYNLIFGSNARQQYLTFGSDAYQDNLTFGSNAIQANITFESNANQNNLTFGSNANQANITFGSNASQNYITFGSGAYQQNLSFGSNAAQQNLTFAEYSQLDFNNQTINSNIEYVSFRTKYITVPDLSAATYIYDSNIKEVYQRPDNTLKIRYYDNSDVLQIVDIDD